MKPTGCTNIMKKISLITIFLILLAGFNSVPAQKKSKTIVKGGNYGRIMKSVTKPKVEVENWKEFESTDLKLKLIFPKEPTESVNSFNEAGVKVKSSVIQSFINTDYYMVEVREYPPNALPERADLIQSYGAWMKTFILRDVKVISDKAFDFGQFKMVEFVYQQTANEVLIHRSMVVGQKLYQIIIQFEIKKPDTLEQTFEKNKSKIDKFFLSFELTDEQFIS
jgi:hypothetical protein